MYKIKIIKVVHPEIVGYIKYGFSGDIIYEYRCPCGHGVGEGDMFCSCCGNELDWSRVKFLL